MRSFILPFFGATPLILQLALIYFATPQLIGYQISAIEAGVITFALNSAAYSSENHSGGHHGGGIRASGKPPCPWGCPYRLMMLDIILPQAFKNILPALVNESIALLKDSALVSTIGALDLMRRGMGGGRRKVPLL